jgi:outer membrane protein
MKTFLLIITLALTACQTVIIPAHTVQTNLNSNLSTQLLYAEGKLPEKLTLLKAKSMTVKGNPDIAAAGQRIARAKAIIEQAHAAYYPTISARAGIRHQHLAPETIAGRPGQSETYTAGLSASWLVYDGLIREHRVLAATYSELSAKEQFKNVERLLLDAVAQAYYQTMLAYKQMDINLELKKINESFLGDSKIKLEAGTAAKTEVNNFLVNVNDSQISYLDSKNAFETAKMALVELMGLPGIDTDSFIPVFDKIDISIPELKTAIGVALNQRPDLKALQADILAIEAQEKQAKGEYLPTVTLDANAGASSINHGRFGDDNRDTNISANVNWNLFTGGSTAALIKQRQAEKKEQFATLKSRWNEIVSQIRQQRQSLQNSLARLEVQKQTVTLNKSIYDDTKEIFNNGATTITRVNEVLTNYTVSRLNQVLFEIETLRRKEIMNALMGINNK